MAHDGEDERRSNPRIRLRKKVLVTLRDATHETHTINVSSGGASVELVDAPAKGTHGSISMPLTEGAPLDFSMEVRWISELSTVGPGGTDRRYLVGLQFLSIAPEAAQRLADALAAEDEDDDDREIDDN